MTKIREHLLEEFETLKDLFDNAPDLIHVAEPGGKIIYVNNAWKNTLGYRSEDIRGVSIYSLVQDKDRNRFKDYRESILAGTLKDTEIIIALVQGSGGLTYVEGIVSARVEDGRPVYTRGIFRNVTRRLRNEEQLKLLHEQAKERESNLRQLFFYAPDAIVVIDSNSIIREWNPKAEQIFGWLAEEVVGRSLSQFIIPPQHRAAHEAGLRRFLTTAETRILNKTVEITALNKEGREFYVSLTISSTAQNGALAFIAFIRDIDEQNRNARELEHRKIQLEASNQQLEQFAHVVSHDIEAPARKILMFAGRLKSEIEEEVASARALDFIRKVENAASRLINMVEGVLHHSSLKAEEVTVEKVDLNALLKDIEADLELIFEEKNAVIRYLALPVIEGSPILLYQLFYNLINNSLKFSKPDVYPLIEFTARPVPGSAIMEPGVDPELSYFEIIIRDNGIGFPQQYAESIFKTFSRLHSRDKYEGTGMGLSLCKSIVERHHGFIYAFGREHEGAMFTIYLPERLGDRLSVTGDP